MRLKTVMPGIGTQIGKNLVKLLEQFFFILVQLPSELSFREVAPESFHFRNPLVGYPINSSRSGYGRDDRI